MPVVIFYFLTVNLLEADLEFYLIIFLLLFCYCNYFILKSALFFILDDIGFVGTVGERIKI